MFIKKQGTRSKHNSANSPEGVTPRRPRIPAILHHVQKSSPSSLLRSRNFKRGIIREAVEHEFAHRTPAVPRNARTRSAVHFGTCSNASILPRAAAHSIVRIHTLAVREDVSLVCSLVVDCSGTTPHDDDRVSQCLRGWLSRHLSHVVVRVISGQVDRAPPRPARSTPIAPFDRSAFLWSGSELAHRRWSELASRPVPIRCVPARPAARIACMHGIDRRRDETTTAWKLGGNLPFTVGI
jgi:hypothetical protein